MIAASLVLVLAVRASILPMAVPDTTLPGAAAVVQTAADSQSPQPGKFDPTRFDSVTAIAIRSLLDSAAAHKLPAGQLLSRALQGASMRATSKRIIDAVRAHYLGMLDARAALGDDASESELGSGADALRVGVDGKALVAIRSARPVSGSAVTALVVLTDVIKRGISTGKARDAILSLCRASKSDDGLNALQQVVARNAERGPGMAQDALDRYLKANVPGSTSPAPAKTVPRPPGPPDAP